MNTLSAFNIPNLLSLSRIPLALIFVKGDFYYRVTSLALAMISDSLDGFLARRYNLTSKIGTLLDPLADRFFVFTIILAFLEEARLLPWEAFTMLCRDCAVMIFGFYLVLAGKLTTYRFRAIWCGKITTFLQFLIFACITLGIAIPSYIYSGFVFLGFMALVELYLSKENCPEICPNRMGKNG